jgi:hypothetical protein
MRLIDTEEAAKRLARVILSDIRLYNREKIRTGGDLRAELEEGYALFRSRVAPPLLPLFKKVLADNSLGSGAGKSAGAAPASVARPSAVPARALAGAAVARPIPAPAVERRPPPAEPRPQPPAPRPAAVAAPEAAPSPALPPRRGRVDTEEGARRLARVIVSDIQLYNPGKSAGDRDLTAQINDGRLLFRSRVAPGLVPLFDEVLGASRLGNGPSVPADEPDDDGMSDVFEAATVASPSPLAVPAPVVEEERTLPRAAARRLDSPPPPLEEPRAAPRRVESPLPSLEQPRTGSGWFEPGLDEAEAVVEAEPSSADDDEALEPPTLARYRAPEPPVPAQAAEVSLRPTLAARLARIPRPRLVVAAVAAAVAMAALIYLLV